MFAVPGYVSNSQVCAVPGKLRYSVQVMPANQSPINNISTPVGKIMMDKFCFLRAGKYKDRKVSRIRMKINKKNTIYLFSVLCFFINYPQILNPLLLIICTVAI